MKYLLVIFGVLFAKAQYEPVDMKLLLEVGLSTDFTKNIETQNPAFGFGIWYRHPSEHDVRLELGGNFKTGTTIYKFEYGKNGSFYDVNSKGFILNLGGRMIHDFTIKNQKLEWISELTFNNFFFDGTGIPDDPVREPINDNTIVIIVDAETISSLQFGQGLRFWSGNLGFGIKASFTPYRLWYKTTIPYQINVFSAEATLSIRL